MIKRIKKEQVVGSITTSDKDGNILSEKLEVVDEVVVDKPMANVGVKIGTTKNMGDYESLRVDVTLYMPSETDKKSLERTFKKTYNWVNKRLGKAVKGDV